LAAASTGDKGPRCQPPSAVHRHVIVSNGGVGGTGECYSQKQLPFRCVLIVRFGYGDVIRWDWVWPSIAER